MIKTIKTKKEAYLFLIYWLQENEGDLNPEDVLCARQMLRAAFENHEQDYKAVFDKMNTFMPRIANDRLGAELSYIIQDLSRIDYSTSRQEERFENLISRTFESCIGVELFLNPTQAMMNSVFAISLELIKLLQKLKDDSTHRNKFEKFLQTLDRSSNMIACGAFNGKPTIKEVIAILEENNSQEFARIMHIHYKFAGFAMREVPLSTVVYREPVGGFLDRINEFFSGGYQTFFQALSEPSFQGYSARALISDRLCYLSPLYTAERNRGRKEAIRGEKTNQLGIMLPSQRLEEFPLYENQEWVADARSQVPDFESQYVHDLIDNEGVYVAGPSGMTSLLLALMENIGNFDSIAMKQNYLSAILAYIVGGGFHSIHEVIGPAQYALCLVPDYQVSPPVRGQLAAPPRYKVFFDQQERVDPEFYEYRQIAWKFLLIKFSDQLRQTYSRVLERFSLFFPVCRASEKYLNRSNEQKYSMFSFHGFSGQRKVEYLKVCYERCNTLAEMIELLSDFFNETGEFNSTDYSAKSPCCEYSFISFLLNELKQDPAVIDLLSRFSIIKWTLTEIDYTLADADASRAEVFQHMARLRVGDAGGPLHAGQLLP